jgi:acetoin utilization deacetylase AcuC-like enzyme
MYNNKIKTFYNPKQVLEQDSKGNYSKSPLKPKLLLEYLEKNNFIHHFDITSKFKKFTNKEFLIAHTSEYVNAFFKGEQPLCESNSLRWSPQFADSIRYTNSSLYHAIKHSIAHPEDICFSPVSGMHHATPEYGSGFCSMSGQVIASTKIFREMQLAGAYIDLDGHFGNSIEDSREYVPCLEVAVPRGCNINPTRNHKDYIMSLEMELHKLGVKILDGEIHYVVFAHGADSHEADDMFGQCTTEEWLKCSTMVYEFIKDISKRLGKPFPLTLALFGGYRADDYEAVLKLHTADLLIAIKTLVKTEK